jgi:site-specific DNA recombinase
MASPEQIQAWARQRGIGRPRSRYRADDCDDHPASQPTILRFAWMARVSTKDMQDPTLSLPRQLSSCQRMLPDKAVIVCNFYDVESGRMDLDARGRGNLHELFDIPIPRDGGIADLLAEAERPDRRFDYVICEGIDRTARRMYYGVQIEHRLEQAGVRLLAADEPFQLATRDGRKPKMATQLLTRRVKQSIAEFYVVDLLEKSWDGFAVHTEQGYNVGKPCYGYRAHQIPHPVPAKRAKGEKKTFLEIDPDQAPAVRQAFAWRVDERLGYQAIADRLNLDLATYPPPVPVSPTRAVGCWTYSNVRDILTNPKYTGYMVWNRRGRKSRGNRINPISEWIWSPHPVHEALIDLETWLRAQDVGGHRFGSRSTSTLNVNHPDTKRSYLLRTYLFCGECGRRMSGKVRHKVAYYNCQPKKHYRPEGHPNGLWVREDGLVGQLNGFLSQHVFGAYRRMLLDAGLRRLDVTVQQEREQRVAALRRKIADVETRSKNLIRSLESMPEPDQDFFRELNERRAELRDEKARLEADLGEVEQQIEEAPNPDLLDALPIGPIEVDQLPEDLARRLFEALRLEIHYDRFTNRATCRITLFGSTMPAIQRAAHDAVVIPLQRTKEGRRSATALLGDNMAPTDGNKEEGMPTLTPVPILVVPPAGLEPAAK